MEERWESVIARPAPALRRYLSSYTGYLQSGGSPGCHRGLPSPYVTLILTLDEPLLLAAERSGAPVGRYDALVGGLHTVAAHVVHPGRQAGIQVGLTPLGARALLGLRAGGLAGLDAHADDVLGRSVVAVREQLLAAGSWARRFAVLDAWLSAEADHDAAVPPELAEAWRLVTTSRGTIGIAELAGAVGWSTRHLRTRMCAEMGLTPKAAARVARFHRARRLLQRRVTAGSPPSLGELAATCGYADQAHLAREFRDLAGCAPTVWVAEEFPNVQAVPRPAMARSRHEC